MTNGRIAISVREARFIANLLFELEMAGADTHTENMARKYKNNLIKYTKP